MFAVRYELQSSIDPPTEGRLCYVLETARREDRLVLEDLCVKRGWRQPSVGLPSKSDCGYWTMRARRRWFVRRAMPRDLAELATVLGRQTDGYSDVCFLPVAIFWGRAPAQEHSWLKLLLSEDWGLTGRLRRSLVVLMHGRDVVVKVGEPVSVRELADEDMSTERLERKLGRVLRVFFQGQRAATIGPDLSHRRLLL